LKTEILQPEENDQRERKEEEEEEKEGKPGIISSVTAAPPIRLLLSKTPTRRPALAR